MEILIEKIAQSGNVDKYDEYANDILRGFGWGRFAS